MGNHIAGTGEYILKLRPYLFCLDPETPFAELGQCPIVFFNQLVDHIAFLKLIGEYFPGVGLHLEMAAYPGVGLQEIQGGLDMIAG